jgi:AcrR family transcriptional regulator
VVTQQRAIETRAALLDAAIDCLVEGGYSATTTTEVAQRAGVSRGAQLHHFPTKADLLAAAVDHLLERRVEEFRKAFANAGQGVKRTDAAVDVLWTMFQSPCFVAWAELWMAARTDAALAAPLVEIDRRFQTACEEIFDELFPDVDPVWLQFVFTVLEGQAFNQLLERPDPGPDVIPLLKGLI